jgi:hypothetical protein
MTININDLIQQHVDLEGLTRVQEQTVIAIYQRAAENAIPRLAATNPSKAQFMENFSETTVGIWSLKLGVSESAVKSRIRKIEQVRAVADDSFYAIPHRCEYWRRWERSGQLHVIWPKSMRRELARRLFAAAEEHQDEQTWMEGIGNRAPENIRFAVTNRDGILRLNTSIKFPDRASVEVAVDEILERFGNGQYTQPKLIGPGAPIEEEGCPTPAGEA